MVSGIPGVLGFGTRVVDPALDVAFRAPCSSKSSSKADVEPDVQTQV